MNAFKDTSIFQNISEFTDHDGKAYRAEFSFGLWKIFSLVGDIACFERTVKASGNATPKTLYKLLNA